MPIKTACFGYLNICQPICAAIKAQKWYAVEVSDTIPYVRDHIEQMPITKNSISFADGV